MFGQTFVATAKTDKTTTVLFSFMAQAAAVIVGILIPMIYFNALPTAQLKSLLVAPPPPLPPPAPPQPVSKVVKIIPRQFVAGVVVAPTAIPKVVALITESELPPPSAVSDGAGVVNPGALFETLVPVSRATPPPPSPIEKIAAPPAHIRVGGVVQSAKLVRQPRPVYPELAIKARIQGIVKLHALISKEGVVQDLRVVSGHPLLVPAALEAVRQWVYRPTLLNGEAVGVETDIDVNFTLQ